MIRVTISTTVNRIITSNPFFSQKSYIYFSNKFSTTIIENVTPLWSCLGTKSIYTYRVCISIWKVFKSLTDEVEKKSLLIKERYKKQGEWLFQMIRKSEWRQNRMRACVCEWKARKMKREIEVSVSQ